MKKVSILLFVVGGICLFCGLTLSFVVSLKEDRVATLARMSDIKDEYKNFSNSVDVFNDIRNSLYLNVFENMYIDTMSSKDKEIKETLLNYESSVNDVAKTVNKLSNLCGTIYFSNSNINDKCDGYANVYEQIVNAFVSDVTLYNNNVLQYNEYQKESGTDSLLSDYKTEKKYIDYNNDKKFDGKDE